MPNDCRPMNHLRVYGKRYRGAWKQFERFVADRGAEDFTDWPDWCYCPMAAAHAIVTGGQRHCSPEQAADVGPLAALAAWRMTRTIYRYDQVLYESLLATEHQRLPVEALYRLPEWCVYIETPGFNLGGDTIEGFFAHLEWDANTGRHEFRFVLDLDSTAGPTLVSLPMHLSGKTVKECMAAMVKEAERQSASTDGVTYNPTGETTGILASLASPMLSLVLYLCSDAPDYDRQPPGNPRPKKIRRGVKLFPASSTTTVSVGVRMGAALTKARREASRGSGHVVTGRKSPVPHIRRAHWHGYWVGPKKGERRLIVKWLPPIAVKLGDELQPTVRKVK